MPRLLKRPEAESDLDEIWWYIAQDNPDKADRFLDRLQERCWALADFPQMGTSRDDLNLTMSHFDAAGVNIDFHIEGRGYG